LILCNSIVGYYGRRGAIAVFRHNDRGLYDQGRSALRSLWDQAHLTLGHLLWDPPTRLDTLKVVTYLELQSPSGDPVEARANAFAIAFLAPPRAVARILDDLSDRTTMVAVTMDRFGIGPGAAKHHLANVAREHFAVEMDFSDVPDRRLPVPSDEWRAREDWTSDFFPVPSVPDTRRGLLRR
jgi:hypothetical protein